MGRSKISRIRGTRVCARVYVCACECAPLSMGPRDYRTMRYLVGRPANVPNAGYVSSGDAAGWIFIYVRLSELVFCQEFYVCRYSQLKTSCVCAYRVFALSRVIFREVRDRNSAFGVASAWCRVTHVRCGKLRSLTHNLQASSNP